MRRFGMTALLGGVIVSTFACKTFSGASSHLRGAFDGATTVDAAAFRTEYNTNRKIIAVHRHGQVVDLQTSTLPIRIEVLREDLIKVRYANRANFGAEYTWSIAEGFAPKAVDFQVDDTSDAVTVRTDKLSLVVARATGLATLRDRTGNEVVAMKGLWADAFDDAVNQVPGKPPQRRLLLGARFAMHPDEHFYGLGEKLRGKFDQSLDWRGRKRDMDPPGASFGNHFEGADGGANGDLMVPFVLSTRGAGVFLDTAYRTYWEFDDPQQSSWYTKVDCDQDWEKGQPRCDRAEMRFYFMVGATPPDIIDRYTDVTGKPLMPPRWMLGFLQSNYGYDSWQEVKTVVSGLRGHGFPLDGVFLDLQWFGGVPGVHGENGQVLPQFSDCTHRRIGSFAWAKGGDYDFSGPRANLAELAAQGVHILPIEEGYFDTCLDKSSSVSHNFSDAEAAGYLARRGFDSTAAALYANGDDAKDASPNTVGYFGRDGMIDTSSAAARQWFWSKHLPILQDGAALFWTDLGEPERFRWWWKYDSGLWHQDIHNVWDLNRARAFYEGFMKDLPKRRPFVMSRSGYAGSQRFGVGVWSADAPAKLGWAAAEPSAHLNLAISGIPYSTSDIGGFGGFPFSNGAQFTRWLQMESLSSLTRAHGNTTVGANARRIVQPDGFGEPYTTVNRRYLLLREELIPYIYTHAREAFDTGMPIVRALPLLWPGDHEAADLGSEFMLGPSILVAPVLLGTNNAPAESRDIYLPQGHWVDMDDGQTYPGGQWLRNFPAPLAKLPRFALAGAIIPKAPAATSVSDPAWNSMRIFELYPATVSSSYTLYDDDGVSNDYRLNGAFARTPIAMSPAAGQLRITVGPTNGHYTGMLAQRSYALEVHLELPPRSLTWNGQTVPITTDNTSAVSLPPGDAHWNAELKKLFVAFPAGEVTTQQIYTVAY